MNLLPLRPVQAANRTTEFNKGMAEGLALLRRTSIAQALSDGLALLTPRPTPAPATTPAPAPATAPATTPAPATAPATTPAEPDTWRIVVDPADMRRLAGVPSGGVAADAKPETQWVTGRVVEARFGARYVGNLAAWFRNAGRNIKDPEMARFIRKRGAHYEYELAGLESYFERTGKLCDPSETHQNRQALMALQALPVLGRTVHRCK